MKYNFDEELKLRGTDSIKWDVYDDPQVIAMGCADMDFRTAPKISEGLKAIAAEGRFSYHFKPDAYFDSIIKWYARRFSSMVKKEWICNMPGVFPTIRMCLQTYAKPGDSVIVQTPHFGPINTVVKHAGCRLVTNHMIQENGKYAIDFDDFERKIIENKPTVYLMINPHNPTGRVFTVGELSRLAQICKAHHVLMISDEVHGNILHGDNKHIPLFEVTKECVVITAPSKGYNLMDLTYCILVIPNTAIREKFLDSMNGFTFGFATNRFGVMATEIALSEECDEWLNELTSYLGCNLSYMKMRLAAMPQITLVDPEAGYLAWIDCRDMNMSPENLKRFFLTHAKVGLSWGEEFGDAGCGFERINFACRRETLRVAMDRIEAALNCVIMK